MTPLTILDVEQLYQTFLLHIEQCPKCKGGQPLCPQGTAALNAWGHADQQASNEARGFAPRQCEHCGAPSVSTYCEVCAADREPCANCHTLGPDQFGHAILWHEDLKRWIHPNCVGEYRWGE